MDTASYTSARANLGSTMERVCEAHIPVIRTCKNENPLVMMSLEGYHAIEETTYPLRSLYQGIGNPVPLKRGLADYWSRRINDEHRIVYKWEDNTISIAQLRCHYSSQFCIISSIL